MTCRDVVRLFACTLFDNLDQGEKQEISVFYKACFICTIDNMNFNSI